LGYMTCVSWIMAIGGAVRRVASGPQKAAYSDGRILR
jgi:hypothetical protein